MNTIRLQEVLQETINFVRQSEEAVFAGATPEEIVAALETAISQIERHEKADFRYLSMLYAATGPIQETAMSSGWHKDYMRLSSEFDILTE